MNEYHKIDTVYKRDMANGGKIIIGAYSEPEFEYLKDNKWVFTEKVDGTNIRVMWNGESVVFGGKTDNAQLPVFLLYKLQELFEGTAKKEIFKNTFKKDLPDQVLEVCLYGEGYGYKIQKGGGNYIADGVDFVLFDVKIGDWWLQREDVEGIAKAFGIKIVPIVGEGTLQEGVDMVQKGFNSQWGNFIAEGLVLRPATELKTRSGHRVITKIKYRDFSLTLEK
jgi:ATP-dependent RNA circularization protein (DNA/RNA ligase family)